MVYVTDIAHREPYNNAVHSTHNIPQNIFNHEPSYRKTANALIVQTTLYLSPKGSMVSAIISIFIELPTTNDWVAPGSQFDLTIINLTMNKHVCNSTITRRHYWKILITIVIKSVRFNGARNHSIDLNIYKHFIMIITSVVYFGHW